MKFVEEYGRHPCLWDHDHVDYKNKQARDAALSSLVKTMSIDGFDIQAARKKIRIIRSTYWNELTKISNSKKADSGTDTIYKPKLPWFSVASRFLSKVTNWKDTQPNLVSKFVSS